MRTLLFISPTFPYPPDKGWNVRILNLARACAEDFEVTFIAPPASDEEGRAALAHYCRTIIPVQPSASPVPLKKKLLYSLRLFEKIDSGRAKTLMGYEEALKKVTPADFDLIWVERRDIYSLVRKHGKKIILDLDDIEHKKLWREITLRQGFAAKLKGLPRFLGIFLSDVFAARGTRAVLVCSDEDTKYLKKIGLSQAALVPNGTGIDSTANDYEPANAPRMAVFLGNMAYSANADAVLHFDRDILPLLKNDYPDLTLDVIGNKPADTGGFSSSIRFLGFVDDIAAELRQYKAMIVPLRFGGGTKLKVIDGMACGVPLVTSDVGAEGLAIVHDRHALIANTPEDFAKSLKRMFREPETAKRLSREAYDLAMKNFNWANIRRNLAAWLRDIK